MKSHRWTLALSLLAVPVLLLAQDKKDEKKDEPKKDEPKPAASAPAPAAPAGDAVDLKWKFEKDKTFYQEMTTDTKQTMKVMGMDIVQNQKQTFIFSWTPEKQDEKDKSWTIRQKIEGIKMDIEIGGNKFTYDSTKDTSATNPLADFFKAIVGSEFKLTVSPDMKVTGVTGKDEFLKKLINANQQMEPLLKTILSDDALKQMADPTFGVIPGKEVTKGEKWTRSSTLSLGPIGGYKSEFTYTYEGKDEKDANIAKIKVETKLDYQLPTEAEGLPFRITSAKLKADNAGGTIRFDIAKGRIADSELKLQLSGTLEIEIGGTKTNVELKQEQTTTVKNLDTNPAATKK